MPEKYSEYYIAFIDILGFKDLVFEKKCDEICNVYNSIKRFRTIADEKTDGEKIEVIPVVPQEKVHVKIMSDSVCIFIPSDEKYSLYLLTFLCLDFQLRMLELTPPVLLRGAITKGLLYSNDDVIFGPGFVNAYLMEENNADVPRIIINKSDIDEYMIRYNQPKVNFTERDSDAFYCLDYISCYCFDNRNDIEKCKKLYSYICDVLNTTTDNSVRKKYLYLESKILPWLKYFRNNSETGIN